MAVKPLSPSTVPTVEDERCRLTVATVQLPITVATVPDSLALLPWGVAIGCILGSQVQEQKVEMLQHLGPSNIPDAAGECMLTFYDV
jgi:hypothetical protein